MRPQRKHFGSRVRTAKERRAALISFLVGARSTAGLTDEHLAQRYDLPLAAVKDLRRRASDAV